MLLAQRKQRVHYLRALGPGLITGASDNDPAGISTYSVAGARTGYTFLWLSIISFPLMVAVQDIAARIGAVREEGLGQTIGDTFGRGWFTTALIVLAISNLTTIGADLAGVSAAMELIFHVHRSWFVLPVAAVIILVEVFWSYRKFADYLKYLTLILFAYVFAGFLAKPDWGEVLRGTFIPTISLNSENLAIMVGVLGTTISPYLFFWQASEEVEEIHEEERKPPHDSNETVKSERWRLIDTVVGMFYSAVIFYFIVLATGATLHPAGISITTADELLRRFDLSPETMHRYCLP